MTRFYRRAAIAALLASSTLGGTAAFAQSQPAEAGSDTDIVVTAQKREENLQNVPISIQALSTKKLDELNLSNVEQFTKVLPSVSIQSVQPGNSIVYMRGVASGGDGNHSGSLPSVGVYLDEQPVTTIGGTLDVHIYDVARIESLSGPQGTLYGASSEAGTIRIITNKPNLTKWEGRVDGELNSVAHGSAGGKIEGMINAPLTTNMALRVVGFYQRNGGYIDNVAATRSFINSVTVNNQPFVKNNYNDTELWGGRAALKIDLNDTWTATPTVQYQDERSHGVYAFDPSVGDLKVEHFYPEYRRDRYVQGALTIEGKVGNWDLTYAGAYLDRKDYQVSDYTDYAEAYDQIYASVGGIAGYLYIHDKNGNPIDPRQYVIGQDHFKKMSQELRVSSPQSDRLRITAGLFFQRQSNAIDQDYRVPNLGPDVSVNGQPGTLWLTRQHRVDRDYAVFGEAAFDILPKLTLTAGGRAFMYRNTLIGFFGFGRNPGNNYTDTPYNAVGSSGTGVVRCFATDGLRLRGLDDTTSADDSQTRVLLPGVVPNTPCTDLGQYETGKGVVPIRAVGSGFTHKLNLTWKPTDHVMIYGTWSRGFRPGGINRRTDVPAYNPDYLTNYELGAKLTLFDGKAHLNGAIYQQNWDSFQFSFLGPNSFTIILNGPNARIRGAELDGNIRLGGLQLSAAGSYTDAKTLENLCAQADPTFTCASSSITAPAGTQLPVTPKFKVSGSARYTAKVGSGEAYGQLLVAHQSSAPSAIRSADEAILGRLHQYTTGDAALGYTWSRFMAEIFVSNLWDERGEVSKFNECGACSQRYYIYPVTPRTIGVRVGAKF
jgi:outer membrane receptor protein involved in Fe transport